MRYLCFTALLVSIIACTTNNRNQFVNENNQETIEYKFLNSFDTDMVNNMDYYYFIDDWYWFNGKENILGGKLRVQLTLFDFNENNNRIKIQIHKDMTGFGQIIWQRVIAEKKEGKYEFKFNDGWGNKAFGELIFNKDGTITFYLDCNEFSDSGKNLGRLYGDTYVLQN